MVFKGVFEVVKAGRPVRKVISGIQTGEDERQKLERGKRVRVRQREETFTGQNLQGLVIGQLGLGVSRVDKGD